MHYHDAGQLFESRQQMVWNAWQLSSNLYGRSKFLGEVDAALFPGMSSREKIPHILRHLDAERLSPRTAASLVEVDRSLSTWPQLSSEVVLGATAIAESVRRIGLGKDLRSGRTRIDVGSALDRLDEPQMAIKAPPPPAEYPDPALPGVTGARCSAGP